MNIIVVTPAGRERYLKILYKNLIKQKGDFNKWHLWLNTKNDSDINYINNLEKNNDWIEVIKKDIPLDKLGTNRGIRYFFNCAIDKNTIYIRLDDDIVYLEDKFIEKLSNFREKNREFPLVFANIINNNVINHYHSNNNIFNFNEKIENNCSGNLHKSQILPLKIHTQFLNDIKNNDTKKYYLNDIILNDFRRVSINAISWIGGDFNNFLQISEEEEQWLSVTYPFSTKRPNIILGNVLCSHAAFFTQRTPILEKLIQNYNDIV